MSNGKHPLSAVSKHLKSKGLQKLRWYCQLCEKQCRDENGFKCHCISENHLRRVQLFGSNSTRVVNDFSSVFEQTFLKVLQTSYRRVRVEATKVYNEVIAHKTHVHMNATKWTTLTEFVKHLGSRSDCVVEDTAKGWFIVYKPVDAEETLRRQLENKRGRESAAERGTEKVIKVQLARKNEIAPIQAHAPSEMEGSSLPQNFIIKSSTPVSVPHATSSASGPSLTDQSWLFRGLVVKTALDKQARKGVIAEVHEGSTAFVNFSGKLEKMRQSDLVKVIPSAHGLVLVTGGEFRGLPAKLLRVDVQSRTAEIVIDEKQLITVSLDEICKVARVQ